MGSFVNDEFLLNLSFDTCTAVDDSRCASSFIRYAAQLGAIGSDLIGAVFLMSMNDFNTVDDAR
jgi:hypothetical protein